MKKPLPTKSISDLRKEREIAQLQQTIRSLRAELHMERSRRQLAEEESYSSLFRRFIFQEKCVQFQNLQKRHKKGKPRRFPFLFYMID